MSSSYLQASYDIDWSIFLQLTINWPIKNLTTGSLLRSHCSKRRLLSIKWEYLLQSKHISTQRRKNPQRRKTSFSEKRNPLQEEILASRRKQSHCSKRRLLSTRWEYLLNNKYSFYSKKTRLEEEKSPRRKETPFQKEIPASLERIFFLGSPWDPINIQQGINSFDENSCKKGQWNPPIWARAVFVRD